LPLKQRTVSLMSMSTCPCQFTLQHHHVAMRRKSIISKWLLFSLDRSGVKTLPPSEKSLSTAALAGNVVLRDRNICLICISTEANRCS